jgi:hypothetical protein
MTLQIAALREACAETAIQAAELEYAGRVDTAADTLEAHLRTLYTQTLDADAQGLGWLRVAHLLATVERRIALDMLDGTRLGQLQLRLNTLLDLPEIATVDSLNDIHEAIVAAVQIGSPRYNAGDVRGCCTVYWATGNALLYARVTRGFAGYTRALAPLRQVHEAEVPVALLDPTGTDAYAWAMRRAFDAAQSMLAVSP